MTTETKNILINSLNEFENMDFKKQLESIKHVNKQLERNQFGLDTIGMGLSVNHIKAAEMFLRIVNYKFSKYSW